MYIKIGIYKYVYTSVNLKMSKEMYNKKVLHLVSKRGIFNKHTPLFHLTYCVLDYICQNVVSIIHI